MAKASKDREKLFVVETSYKIKYTNKQPVPIPDIIESLSSLERILRRTPGFVEKYYKDIKIVETQIYVSSIESGSLIEDFVIRYVFKGQGNYDKAKDLAHDILGDNEVLKTIVAIGVGSVITYGLMSANGSEPTKPAIEAYNNTIINIGADVDFKAADIQAVLKGLPKKTVARDAVQAVRPAKNENGATIEMADNESFTMPKKFIEQAPYQYEPPVPDERETKYTNVEIFIYASDRDNAEKGWAGIVPQLFDHRVKFSLGDSLDPKRLHGRTKARADVVVHEKFVKEKKTYEVKMVEITAVN